MEEVISDIKVIETDDGFRIEIKGDKEKIKEFMKDFRGPGAWRRGGRRGRHGPRGPFPFAWNPMMWMHMAPPWASWYEEEEETEEA